MTKTLHLKPPSAQQLAGTNTNHDIIQLNSLPTTDGGTGSGEQGKRRAEDEEDSAQHTQQKVCRGL